MLDKDRGTYSPPTEDNLAYETRRTSGRDQAPITLILSGIFLVILLIAVILFYNSGLNNRTRAPQEVGETLGEYREAVTEAKPLAPDDVIDTAPSTATLADATSSQAPIIDEAPPTAAAITTGIPSQSTASSTASVATAPAPSAPVSGGVSSVQIGAFASRDIADRQYNSIVSSYGIFLDGTAKRVEEVQSNGSTLYRTSVTGFASKDKAREFCSALKSAGRDCFVK